MPVHRIEVLGPGMALTDSLQHVRDIFKQTLLLLRSDQVLSGELNVNFSETRQADDSREENLFPRISHRPSFNFSARLSKLDGSAKTTLTSKGN